MLDYIIIGLLIIIIILIIILLLKGNNNLIEKLGNVETTTVKELSNFRTDVVTNSRISSNFLGDSAVA